MDVFGKANIFFSRHHEFMADGYSTKHGHGDDLIKGLVKIYQESKSAIYPDWMYSMFNQNHPTLMQRVEAIHEKQRKLK